MRGKVLGADATGGTISGEDGKRYKFEMPHWKNERAPLAGEGVDFDIASDGVAHDIYALRPGVSLDFTAVGDQAKALLGEGINSPMGAHIAVLTLRDPVFQVSLVIVLASVFLTFLKLSSAIAPGANAVLPDNGIYRIINAGDLIDYLKTSLDAAAALVKQFIPAPGTETDPGLQLMANPQQTLDGLHTASAVSNVLYLLYVAPIGAALILLQSIRSKGLGLLPLVTGAVCVACFGMLVLWRGAIIAAVNKMGNADAAAVAGKAIVFGLGSYVVLLCGLALLGLSLGIIKAPRRA